MSYYIEAVPNRHYRPTTLLRKAWREGKESQKKNHSQFERLSLPLLLRALKQLSKEL